jgi:hypothetical protein
VTWTRCGSYEEARNYGACVYLHEWSGKAYYVGKVDRTFFGGRYGPSYRHWIDGCLEHGARLYVGSLDNEGQGVLDAIESILIEALNPPKNVRRTDLKQDIALHHIGEVPAQLQEQRNSD